MRDLRETARRRLLGRTRIRTIESAIDFIEHYDESSPPVAFDRYELNVRYSNGGEVRGSFPNKRDCLAYLRLLSGA